MVTMASTVRARIGETLDQCQQRYGVMMRVEIGKRQDYPQYVFQKGDVEIRVRLYNGVSAQESFRALKGSLTTGQIAEIEASNSREATGKEVVEDLHQHHDTHFESLVITTTEFHKVIAEPHGSGF